VPLTDVPIGSAITNPETGDQTVLIGVKNSLNIQLVNSSGAPIALPVGPAPATFGVYLPVAFFTVEQLQAMQVTTDGWAGKLDTSSDPPVINISCTRAATWAEDATLTFTIAGVQTNGPAGNDSVAITPANMVGDLSVEVDPQLVAASPPKPGNLTLSDVLQVTLDSQGSVLRSTSASDPLSNTLYLTLKNTGTTALATGATRAGNPQVYVSFVYGRTSGALAFDDYDPAKGAQIGSAWNIKVGIESAQLPWTAADPGWDSEKPHPQWTLTPSQNNLQILGPAGTDQANVTFSFSSLVSITPTGHTQMLVLCDGFARDDQTAYDAQLYVLDIVKVDAPPTRGLLSFFGPKPVIAVADPNGQVTIPLRWSMFDVASVRLLTSSPALSPLSRAYAVPPKPLDYDSTTVSVPAPRASEAIFCTLQAFDAGGGYLNSQQFTAYAQVSYVIDGAGHVYPVALFGDTFWMLQNYQFNATGSYDYGNSAGNEATYGRLYNAQVQPPDGWSLPTAADWTALFARFGGAGPAYTALVAGGKSGFNAQLGGWRTIQPDGSGSYQSLYVYGYYLTAPGNVCAQFSSASKSASVGTSIANPATGLSVRFIRHA
jgi:uncharacterized protein (TIGR02145 family)